MKANFNIAKNVRNSRSISALGALRKLQSIGLLLCALMIGSLQVWGADYVLVKNISNLSVGDEVLLVNIDNSYALGTKQNNNNRTAVSVTISNDKITNPENTVDVLTVGKSGDYWTFYSNNGSGTGCPGYLYAASSSGNYLRTQSSNDNNGIWDVTINTTTGEGSFVAQGTNTRKVMQYNNSSHIFACYSSASQASIYIFKKAASGYTVDFAVSPAGYGTVSPSSQLTGVASGTAITKSGNTVTIGGTTVTATPHSQDATYNYAFNNWTVTDNLTSVTKNVTVTANFTRSAKTYSNYRTLCSTTDPSLSVSPASLTELDYIVGAGPSAAKSFSMSGSNLESGTLTVTAPTNFQVSKASGSGWASSITFTDVSGTLAATTVYVRLASGKSAGEYSGNVSISGCGLESAVQVALSGTVYQPTIIATPASVTGWNAVTGSAPSPATQTIDVTGVNLKADISVSLTSGSDYFSIDKSSFEQTSGSASGTITISVKAAAYASAATRNGNIRLTSTDATTVDVPITLLVQDDPREKFTLLTSSNISDLSDGAKLVLVERTRGYVMNTTSGTNGHEQVNTGFEFLESNTIIALEETNEVEVLTLVASDDGTYLLKTLGNQYIYYSSGNTHKTGALPSPVTSGYQWTISMFPEDNYVNIKSTNCLGYNGGASGQKFRSYSESTITGGYNTYAIYAYYQPSSDPSISLTASLSKFEYVYGSGPSSPAQTFTVSGKNLSNDLVVSVPSNIYEVSKNGSSDWGSSVSYTPSTETVSSQTVYIRLKAGLSANAYDYAAASGLRVTSTGATERNAALEGEVKYSVSISANNGSYGSVSPTSGTTRTSIDVTATPNANYRVPTTGGYTVTSGTATVVNNGDGTFTITPTSNCAVTINFEAIPTHKVTYWATGTKIQESDVQEGAAIPDQTTETASAIEAYCGNREHFVGWTTTSGYSHATDAPAGMITTMSPGGTMSTSDVNYYAVFANGTGEFGKYKRVTSLSDIVAGDSIVIVSNNHGYAMICSSNQISNSSTVSETSSKITPTAAMRWLVGGNASDGYTFTMSNTVKANGAPYTLGAASIPGNNSSNSVQFNASNTTFKITNHNTSGTYYIHASGNVNCGLELHGSGTPSWKLYTYNSGLKSNAYTAMKLYVPDAHYIDYTTECCSLQPVTDVVVNSMTNTSVTLGWTLPASTAGITKFQVIDVDNGNAVVKDNISTSATNSGSISGLTKCNTYHYKVVSYSSTCTVTSSAIEFRPFGDARTVNFNYNGGSGTPASFTTSCDGTSTTLPTPDARDGYTFLGWWSASSGGDKRGDAGDSYTVTGNTTIWAHWAQNFTVTYNRKGGTIVCGGSEIGVAGQTFTICTTEPTRSGYIFAGWDTEEGGTGTRYNAGGTFTMPSSDVTLYAQWTDNWRNLTFNVPAGGGSASGVPSGNHVRDGQSFTMPTITGKSDSKWCWTFLGWTETAPNGSGRWDVTPSYIAGGATSSAITSDKTYYAVYSKTGAGASGTVELTTAVIDGLYQAKLSEAVSGAIAYGNERSYTSNGYTWTTTTRQMWINSTNQHSTYLQFNTANTTWLKLPTLPGPISSMTIDCRNASGNALATGSVYLRTSPTGSNEATGTISSNICTFGETELTTGYLVAAQNMQILSMSISYGPPAIYGYTLDDCGCVVTEFDLTYDANTANFAGSTITPCTGVTGYKWSEHDDEYTICSTVPTCDGYKFSYWATNANGSGTHYNPGEVITCVGETPITLYARYERVHTVTFNNQGTPTPVTQASAGAAIDVPAATTPCSAEWTFAGWSKTAIAPMSLLPELEITAGTSTYTPDEDVTLYAIYRKTSTSSAFVAGMSGAYKIKATYNATDQYATDYNGAKLRYSATPGAAQTYYIKYVAADGGKYTIQQSDGQYIKYQGKSATSGAHTDLALSATEYFWRINASGSLWAVQATTSTDANTHYLQFDPNGSTGFKGYTNGINIAFVAADGQYYYRTMSCEDDFDIIFHENGTTINWATGYPEATYKDLANATIISTFPTATFDGWTFLGWRTADYEESTDAPASASVYGGTDGISGNTITVTSANIDLYPVFTRFEDNQPFDQINGGDYYIYFLDEGSDDGYGAAQRVYAGTYADKKRYNSTALCSAATTFTFTKLENGNWTIYDNTTHMYLYGIENDDLKQQASAIGAEWTLTLNGNQFDAFHVGTSYGQLIAQGGGTSATIMNYRRTNVTKDPASYHRVYLGSCTNRVFSSNPMTIPEIDLKGTVVVTASQNGAVRNTNVLTVSGHTLTPSTGEITITSNNSDVYFSLSTDKNFAKGVADQPKPSVTITANGSGIVTPTPVYVHYKPSSNVDAWTSATITASYTGAEDAEVTAELRTVKENFVIASKVGDNWYALPANMAAEGVFEPVLIDVDESAKIAYGPATVGYKMWPVQTVNGGTDEYAANGDKVRFAGNSNAGLWASNSNNHIRNWATITAIGSTAETPASYEWIIETEDREAYTLKSMYSTNYLDLYRPSSGAHAGKLVWASNSTYETNEIHFFPLTEREVITIIPREWKANGLVFSVAADNQITAVSYKIGTGSETSTTYPRHSTGGYGLYEVVLPDLTSQYGKLLTLKLTISGTPTYATTTIPIIVNANASTKTNEPFATLGAATKDYDVVVLDGKTLTTDAIASGACKFQNLYIYPGATLVNAANNNLSVRYLELRGGIKGIDHKSDLAQGVPHLKLDKNFSSTAGANLDMYVNTAHSYALSVPFDVTLSTVNFANSLNTTTSEPINGTLDAQFMIMEYDGAQRASTGKGWKHITSTERVLHAGEGYVLQGKRPKGQPFAVIRFPFSSISGWATGEGEVTKSAISISAHEGGDKTPDNDKGWNLIANPYMATLSYNGADEGWAADFTVGSLVKTDTDPWDGKYEWTSTTNAYVTMPNEWYTEFPQYRANSAQAVFEPFKNFFIQATADGSVTFDKSKRASAPRHLLAQVEKAQPIYADINLTHGEAFAQAGLTVDENATAGYKFGEDQNIFESREALTYLKMYTVADGHYLVGNTLTPAETEELIPVEFYAPNAGEYIFSLDDNSDIDRLEYVILYDAVLGLNTNLLTNDYMVDLEETGLIENRFSIGLRIKEKDNSATGIGDVSGDPERPYKFIYRDKMYILRGGKIYDATGKQVREINK